MKINLSAIKGKFFSEKPGFKDDITLKDMGILDHIEEIIKISQKFGLEKCLSKGKKHLDYVTKKLEITPVQAVLFSHFLEKSDDNTIQISEIAESINCSKIRMIKYINDCDELEKKKLLRCRKENDTYYYRIPRAVNEALRKNNTYKPEKHVNLSINKFFAVLESIFDERKNNELNYEKMKDELLDLISQNMHLLFCKNIMSYKFFEDDLLLLLCFCHLFVNNNDNNIGSHDFEFMYENKIQSYDFKQKLSTRKAGQ